MIDITTFLNSKDIAGHWKKIGFTCTPVQAAYIIWQSHEKSLQEKHEAWKELMETTPDCPFAEGRRKEHLKRHIPEALTDSLHAFLKAYMALEDKTLERFYREEANTAYGYRSFPESRYEAEWHNDFWLYRTAQDCIDDVNGEEAPREDLAVVEVKKYWIGEVDVIEAQMRADGTVMSLYDEGWTEEEFDLMWWGFQAQWFDFPTPFRYGDVLVRKNSPFLGEVEQPRPFVLILLSTWGREEALKRGESEERAEGFEMLLKRRCEVGDMYVRSASGFLLKDGSLQQDHGIERYLDFEYCREELKGEERILKALSLFGKGEIGIELLLKTYHIVFMEEEARREKKSLHDFLTTTLKEVGIGRGEEEG